MRKKLIGWMILTIVFACDLDDEVDIREPLKNVPQTKFLTEYWEDDILIHSFSFQDNKIIAQSERERDGHATIQFYYSEDGLANDLVVRRRFFDHDLHINYEDSLFIDFEIWNSLGLVQKFLFARDDEGKIIQMAKVSINHGLLYYLTFYWDGDNISKYDYTFFSDIGAQTIVYEMTYDAYRNPYASVFESVGFDFIHYLPLVKNNVSEVKIYEKGGGTDFVLYKNIYAYSNNYPFVKQSIKYEGKIKTEVYSEFKY